VRGYVCALPVLPVLTKKLVVVSSFIPACLDAFVDFLAPDISHQKTEANPIHSHLLPNGY
jgi:hypothetical protein